MALLNRDGELIETTSISNGATIDGGQRITAQADWTPESGDGLLLDASAEPEASFTSAPLIAIDFPAFNDGRGLTLAVLLRTRFRIHRRTSGCGRRTPRHHSLHEALRIRHFSDARRPTFTTGRSGSINTCTLLGLLPSFGTGSGTGLSQGKERCLALES